MQVSKAKEDEKLLEEKRRLESDMQQVQSENQLLKDMINLKDESYFRQQFLMTLERIAISVERQATALETSLEESKENKEEEEQ